MNILYFVKLWPQRGLNAHSEKIVSLSETLTNLNHRVHLLSTDTRTHPQYFERNPIELIDINLKKIQNSLALIPVKPDLIIFNHWEMENLYSAFIQNKWNKCPRIIQVNQLSGLETWRKSNFNQQAFEIFVREGMAMYPQKQAIFLEQEYRALIRSNYIFCGNQFIYHLVNKVFPKDLTSLITSGLPVREYRQEIKNIEYRPFQLRQNFIFIGDLSKQSTIDSINILEKSIWPIISAMLPQTELHIYGSNYNEKLNARKSQLNSIHGFKYKGYLEDQADISRYKALLYPCRFSSGLKQKIIQAWFNHTPVITTPIGAEGMFIQTVDMKHSLNSDINYSGFIKEKFLSPEEEKEEKFIKKYYDSAKFSSSINQLTFGGICDNFTHHEFADNAIKIYNDKNYWDSCLKKGQKIILRHQIEGQLQVNLKQALSKIQMNQNLKNKNSMHQQEWKRYRKSEEYHLKMKNKN